MKHWLGNIFIVDLEVHIDPSPISNWFEGSSDTVSTNNGLEATNRTIKERETLRRRLPLTTFLEKARNTVLHWSACPDHKVILLI
jgi:hypothetical protein